jgi:hypothetical protein
MKKITVTLELEVPESWDTKALRPASSVTLLGTPATSGARLAVRNFHVHEVPLYLQSI